MFTKSALCDYNYRGFDRLVSLLTLPCQKRRSAMNLYQFGQCVECGETK